MAYEKVEITTETGMPMMVLVEPGMDNTEGVPLLDLSGLELPPDMEDIFRKVLWSVGIREYADGLKPGANSKIASAIKTMTRLSIQSVVQLFEQERKYLQEVDYYE